MTVISSKDVYDILKTTGSILNKPMMNHGERTAYILCKMLQTDGWYSNAELADYIMLTMLHDIGLCKIEYREKLAFYEKEDVWPHSIFGFLFLKYLSPLEDKAEIILYHHLPYNKHGAIDSKYMKIAEYLFLADKMDAIMSMPGIFEEDYIKKNYNITYSGAALELFKKADEKYNILNNLKTSDYQKELDDIISKAGFSEEYKRKFLHMLIYINDFRSECTVLHTLATTSFAQSLADIMKLSSQDKYNLFYGALLHDIGKIAIPINILEAPRRLNDKEMEIMRAHVRVSDKILTGLVSEDVRLIAIRHHEKLDGSGYPAGIGSEELNLNQRIVAVADIISALYGKRSYKDSYEMGNIISILQEEVEEGRLCSKVVGVAIRNMNKIITDFEAKRNQIMGTYLQIKKQEMEIYEQFKGL